MDTSQDAKWSEEIATYTATAGDAAMTAILADVQKQTLPLKKLVDLLGSALTSSEDLQRSRGMALLGASINRLGTANLTIDGNSVLVVASFLVERLQDYTTQQEVLDAIRSLLLHHPIPTDKGVIKKITNAVINSERVHVQSMPQPSRKIVYEIIDLLLERYPTSVRDLKSDFVFGFVQAMDGEKDPRNLLLCFKLVPAIVQTVPEYIQFEEDLFDITSCYFPITFTERADDPFAVKKSDLVRSLRGTMIASPKLWTEFLLEKLSSSLLDTKAEVLSSFRYAFTDTSVRRGRQALWSLQDIATLVPTIYSQLTNEIMQSTDPSIPSAALEVVTSLTRFIAQQGGETGLTTHLGPLINMCLRHFKEKQDGKLALLGTKVLQAAAAASYESAAIILQPCMTLMMNSYTSAEQVHRELELRMIVNFAKSTSNFSDRSRPHPLQPYQDELLRILKSAISTSQDESEVIEAIDGLAVLAEENAGSLLAPEQLTECLSLLLHCLSDHPLRFRLPRSAPTSPGAPNNGTIPAAAKLSTAIPAASLSAIVSVSLVHPNTVLAQIIPALFAQLEAKIKLYSDTAAAEQLQKLADISLNIAAAENHDEAMDWEYTGENPKNMVADRVAWLHALCDPASIKHPPTSVDGAATPMSYVASKVVLDAIHQGFIACLSAHFGMESVVANILSSLARTVTTKHHLLTILTAVLINYDRAPQTLPTVSRWLPDLVAHAMRHLSVMDQFLLVKDMIAAFNGATTDSLVAALASVGPSGGRISNNFQPFAPNAPRQQRLLIPMFAACVSACDIHRLALEPGLDVDSMLATCRDIFYTLFQVMENTHGAVFDRREHDIVCMALGSIVNKLPEGSPILDAILNEKVANDLSQRILNKISNAPQERKMGQKMLAWIVKALIQRGHPYSDKLFDVLLQQIDVPPVTVSEGYEVSRQMASKFAVLFVDYDQMPVRRVLYKQKYFTRGLGKLVPWFNESRTSTDQRSVILVALSGMLKGLPKGALLQSASTVVPLLLQALRLPDAALQADALHTFLLLTETDQSLIDPHIQSLIPTLLTICNNDSALLESRIAALECLTMFSKLPYAHIFPHQQAVLHGLKKTLDDRKRTVRKVAVKCRNEWFVISGGKKKAGK